MNKLKSIYSEKVEDQATLSKQGQANQKREQRRNMMLLAASGLFDKFGYKTSMEDIADASGVGVATVYNYFGTKEGVFAALVCDEVSGILEKAEKKLPSLPDDPIKATMSLLRIHNKTFELVSSKLMLQFIWQSKSNGPLHEASDWINEWQTRQIHSVLERFSSTGVFRTGFDAVEAGKIIVELSIRRNQRHYGNFPGGGSSLKELEKSIRFLLNAWMN